MTSLSKKLSSLLLISMLIISNISIVFADTDDISNYQKLDYIQSSGSQYINTGIDLSDISNLKIITDAQFTSVSTSNSHMLFGTGSYSSNTSNRKVFGAGIWSSQGSTWRFINNTTAANGIGIGSGLDTLKHSFIIDLSNNSASLDNTTSSFTNNGSMTTNTLIIFGARSITSSGSPAGYLSSVKLYSFKIYSGSTLLYDYVPVQRISDGEIGLFETVNNLFYGNDGSGNFTSGSSIYEIVTSVSPSGSGTVTGGGSYLEGESATLTASPNTGYIFNGWSDGSRNNPYTFTVTSGLNITANFVPIQSTVTITTSVSPSGSGTVTGGGIYDDGDYVTLTAIPNEGYTFKNWSDGIIANPRSLTVHSNETFIAYFEKEQSEYDVLLSVYPEGYGTVTGSGTYEAGQTIQISAEAEEGYEFVSWSDGSIANPRDITVNSNINLTANFRLQQDIPVIDEDNILLIVLLLSFMILINIGKGEIYNG